MIKLELLGCTTKDFEELKTHLSRNGYHYKTKENAVLLVEEEEVFDIYPILKDRGISYCSKGFEAISYELLNQLELTGNEDDFREDIEALFTAQMEFVRNNIEMERVKDVVYQLFGASFNNKMLDRMVSKIQEEKATIKKDEKHPSKLNLTINGKPVREKKPLQLNLKFTKPEER